MIYLITITMIMSVVMFFSTPVKSVPTYKAIVAGKLLRIDESVQGFFTFSNTLYFTGYSRALTGGINDFANVKLGSSGYVMPRLGFCSDTLGSTMTLTSLAINTVVYTTNATGTQRIWCPDRGEPTFINGDSSNSWDGVNSVVNINTLGASTVTVSWSAIDPASPAYDGGAGMIIQFMQVVIVLMVVGAIKNPDHRGILIEMAIVSGVITLLMNLMYSWGL